MSYNVAIQINTIEKNIPVIPVFLLGFTPLFLQIMYRRVIVSFESTFFNRWKLTQISFLDYVDYKKVQKRMKVIVDNIIIKVSLDVFSPHNCKGGERRQQFNRWYVFTNQIINNRLERDFWMRNLTYRRRKRESINKHTVSHCIGFTKTRVLYSLFFDDEHFKNDM